MGFASGSVSFRRFTVTGKHPKAIDEKILDKLAEHVLKPGEYGIPDDVEYGWCGGRHIFDARFTFENNVFADCVHFALRLDTNKVPGELKKAYELMEQDATANNNPSGHISKKQKKDVKEIIKAKIATRVLIFSPQSCVPAKVSTAWRARPETVTAMRTPIMPSTIRPMVRN